MGMLLSYARGITSHYLGYAAADGLCDVATTSVRLYN